MLLSPRHDAHSPLPGSTREPSTTTSSPMSALTLPEAAPIIVVAASPPTRESLLKPIESSQSSPATSLLTSASLHSNVDQIIANSASLPSRTFSGKPEDASISLSAAQSPPCERNTLLSTNASREGPKTSLHASNDSSLESTAQLSRGLPSVSSALCRSSPDPSSPVGQSRTIDESTLPAIVDDRFAEVATAGGADDRFTEVVTAGGADDRSAKGATADGADERSTGVAPTDSTISEAQSCSRPLPQSSSRGMRIDWAPLLGLLSQGGDSTPDDSDHLPLSISSRSANSPAAVSRAPSSRQHAKRLGSPKRLLLARHCFAHSTRGVSTVESPSRGRYTHTSEKDTRSHVVESSLPVRSRDDKQGKESTFHEDHRKMTDPMRVRVVVPVANFLCKMPSRLLESLLFEFAWKQPRVCSKEYMPIGVHAAQMKSSLTESR